MYESWVTTLERSVPADEYEEYTPALRRTYAESLVCTGCGQPAYFIRRARNGRAACFGARPHIDGCDMASAVSSVEEAPVTAEDEFLLRPIEPRTERPEEPGEPPAPALGKGDHHQVEKGAGTGSFSSRSLRLNSLLRRLVRDPDFRYSEATLVLPDGARGPIRTLCVQAIAADARYQNRRRLYWGTIRYAHQDDAGGAWLNLGRRGSASLRLAPEIVTALLTRHHADDIEELQGAAFIAYLPLRKSTTTDRLFLFVEDLHWFALRMPDDDPI